MQLSLANSRSARLPLTRDLALFTLLSLFFVAGTVVASGGGLLFPDTFYPTAELRQAFLTNDVLNLLLGVPILVGSMGLAHRGNLLGLLFWPGALFYGVYNYLAYVFGLPVSLPFLLALTIAALGLYTMVGLLTAIDVAAVQRQFSPGAPVRLAGGVLSVMGLLFLLRVVGLIAAALLEGTTVPLTETAVMVADFLVAPAWIVVGILLWRRRAFGYAAGMGLLFQFTMLFVGVILFVLLQPLLTDAAPAPVDVLVLLLMGLPCFIAFGLFARSASP